MNQRASTEDSNLQPKQMPQVVTVQLNLPPPKVGLAIDGPVRIRHRSHHFATGDPVKSFFG